MKTSYVICSRNGWHRFCYFFKSLFGFVKKYWRTIAAIVVTIYLGPAASAFFGSTIAGGAVAGAVAGAISTGSLRGVLVGALTGAAFGALHNMSAGALKVAAHGVAGGVSSVLNGGKFGHGFLSAGVTQALGNVKGLFTNAPQGIDRISNAVKAAVIGGTISEITGGKFTNGALTGAFSRLLNDDISSRIDLEKAEIEMKVGKLVKATIGKNGFAISADSEVASLEFDDKGNVTASSSIIKGKYALAQGLEEIGIDLKGLNVTFSNFSK